MAMAVTTIDGQCNEAEIPVLRCGPVIPDTVTLQGGNALWFERPAVSRGAASAAMPSLDWDEEE